MANLNWVPNVGYILDQDGTQKILAYYGSLLPKFNAQVQLTAMPQNSNPYGYSQQPQLSGWPSAPGYTSISTIPQYPALPYSGIPQTQYPALPYSGVPQTPWQSPTVSPNMNIPLPSYPGGIVGMPQISMPPAPIAPIVSMPTTQSLPPQIESAFSINPSAVTVSQAIVISDVIQSYVALAQSKALVSGNATAKDLANQAFQKALATVNATNAGQYNQAYINGLQAITFAGQAIALSGG